MGWPRLVVFDFGRPGSRCAGARLDLFVPACPCVDMVWSGHCVDLSGLAWTCLDFVWPFSACGRIAMGLGWGWLVFPELCLDIHSLDLLGLAVWVWERALV